MCIFVVYKKPNTMNSNDFKDYFKTIKTVESDGSIFISDDNEYICNLNSKTGELISQVDVITYKEGDYRLTDEQWEEIFQYGLEHINAPVYDDRENGLYGYGY